LRLACARAPEYTPYFPSNDEELDLNIGVTDALNAEDFPKAIRLIDRLLELNYLYVDAHLFACHAYRQMGDDSKSVYHYAFAESIFRSIGESGDGRSFDSAFKVIGIWEEYGILKVLRLQYRMQQLEHHEGHRFDVFDIANPKPDQAGKLYFNIDLIWNFKNGDPKDRSIR
jgi:hypothetical protein